jgi:N-acetylglucosamine kinase-like BadF-type ATPase
LVCGIDGGGTVTKVVVADVHGNIVDHFFAASINHYGVGIEKAKKCYSTIAKSLIEKLGCVPSVVFVGHSAFSTLVDKEKVNELTDGVFQDALVIFHADVYSALLAFTMGKAGAVVIAGTGSMACGIDEVGNYHTVGGWGQTLGDEGSGYFIGIEGMKAAIRAYEGLGEATTLTDKLRQYFKVEHLEDVIEKVYNPPIEKKDVSAFAKEVDAAALMGDAVAVKILEEAAHWLYVLAVSIAHKCNADNVGYYGSVIHNNSRISAILKGKLTSQNITLVKPDFPAEIGAMYGALQAKGIIITDEIMVNLSKYITRAC